METDVESILAALGYLGIFLLMISNGAISFPSSQVLYIICGYFISTGDLTIAAVVFVGAVGNTIGNIILYELVRFKGLHYIETWQIFPKQELRKIVAAFRKKGIWFLFVGKLIPALKVFVPIIAAIGEAKRIYFIPLMLVSSALWTAPFLAIGYFFGKSSDVFGQYAIAVLIIAFVAMTLFYRYINSQEVLEEIKK